LFWAFVLVTRQLTYYLKHDVLLRAVCSGLLCWWQRSWPIIWNMMCCFGLYLDRSLHLMIIHMSIFHAPECIVFLSVIINLNRLHLYFGAFLLLSIQWVFGLNWWLPFNFLPHSLKIKDPWYDPKQSINKIYLFLHADELDFLFEFNEYGYICYNKVISG